VQSGFAPINDAEIYYEKAGAGQPFVMLHAGVADSRQWNSEFAHFADEYTVIRYDMRGFGRSEPVEGEYSNMADLVALLDYLGVDEPIVIMGCSMGGSLAIDYTLEHPGAVSALIIVGSGPSGMEIEDWTPTPLIEALEAAHKAGDWDKMLELETQLFVDGEGRATADVDPTVRQFAMEMNRQALDHARKKTGKQLPDTSETAAGRLGNLSAPILIVVGQHDEAYSFTAADFIKERAPVAEVVVLEDTAHLANLDYPNQFQAAVADFLARHNQPPLAG
jgi:3-oxoadipate enol-lactonase